MNDHGDTPAVVGAERKGMNLIKLQKIASILGTMENPEAEALAEFTAEARSVDIYLYSTDNTRACIARPILFDDCSIGVEVASSNQSVRLDLAQAQRLMSWLIELKMSAKPEVTQNDVSGCPICDGTGIVLRQKMKAFRRDDDLPTVHKCALCRTVYSECTTNRCTPPAVEAAK